VADIGISQGSDTAALLERLRDRAAALGEAGLRLAANAPRKVVLVVEALLAALIGLVLAHIILPWASLPSPSAEPPPRAVATDRSAESANPFKATAPSATQEQIETAETNLALVLKGTWFEEDGASAIVELDGKQKIYHVGDAICCGAVLREIRADEVIIERAGAVESIRLPRLQNREAPNQSQDLGVAHAESGAAQLADLSLSRFSEIARVEPTGDAGHQEFRLFPGADASAFSEAGLLPGDVLVALDDNPAPPNLSDLGVLLQQMQGKTELQVTVQRDGVDVPLTVRLIGSQVR
jgi:type II secretion system protein C